ncbi:MAG: hypothetical protein C0616_05035 [Desulfuromonas sp.]|nr:MAG: hypothetical protein C0616_05035 [Desulfuromonas sp.]
MKRLIAVLIAVGLIALGSAALVSADNGPAEIKLPAKMGDVNFAHKAHQDRMGECATCHHNGVDSGSCRSCHDGDKAPKAKNVFHKLCKDCHKEKGVSTGCKSCHKK